MNKEATPNDIAPQELTKEQKDFQNLIDEVPFAGENNNNFNYDFLFRDESGLPIIDMDDMGRLIAFWNENLGVEISQNSSQAFGDFDFVANFIREIPEHQWNEYIVNTSQYDGRHTNGIDASKVLVFRRAIPSDLPKPEVFWTTEFREVSRGLGQEINGAQRQHSSIMVATLDKLEKHGTVTTNRGSSDGEIVIDPTKPFNDFLFIYKPLVEQEALKEYLEKGGKTKQQILDELSATAQDRLLAQGVRFEQLNDRFTPPENSIVQENPSNIWSDDGWE